MRLNKFFFTVTLFMTIVVGIGAENRWEELLRTSGIMENNLWREEIAAEMSGPISRLQNKIQEFEHPVTSQRVKIETMVKQNFVFFVFLNEREAGFLPGDKGNFLIKRKKSTGLFDSFRIIYRDEPACYAEITRKGKFSVMNVFLFGRKLYSEISLPFSMETLVTRPLAQLLEATQGMVDWGKLLFHGGREEDRQMADVLRRIDHYLPGVKEAADGALDDQGRFVAIADGRLLSEKKGFNCSGFMKWLIDGIYHPLTEKYTVIEKLKEKHLTSRGNRWHERTEDQRDPFFGLDWTRNLATTLACAQSGRQTLDPESQDIRHTPFINYLEDSGFPVKDLYLVLYFLAVEEPGTIFLGAVNNIYKKNPNLVEYFHVASFFPFFDERGKFQVVILDQHRDKDALAFIGKKEYAHSYVHLVRARLSRDFSLFHIE